MDAQDLRARLVSGIEKHPDDPTALALVLVSHRSPGPPLGIKCERLGPVKGGTAWGITVAGARKALAKLDAALLEGGPA